MNKRVGTSLVLLGLALIGCEQKTESEKLAEQFAKTGSAFEREAKDLARDADRAREDIQREVNSP
jgi:hypothetical protein